MDRIKNIESTRKTPVLSLSQFLNEDAGFQIKMEDFDAELASSYKDITGNDMKSTIDNASAVSSSSKGDGESVDKSYLDTFTRLARKTLPNKLGKLDTEDYLLDTNGSLKKKYSGGFIRAWESALKSSENDIPGYFFYDSGLYEVDNVKSSLNTPCNWPKWVSLNSDKSSDNINAFISNYQLPSYSASFSFLPPNNKSLCMGLFKGDYSIDSKSYDKTMNRLNDAVSKYPSTSYIPYENLVIVRNDLNNLLGKDDWGRDEFITFNNIMVILANTLSFHDGKVISGFRWIYENSNIIPEAGRINADMISGGVDRYTPGVLHIELAKDSNSKFTVVRKENAVEPKISLDSKTHPAFSKITSLTTSRRDGINAVLAQNLYYIVNNIYGVLIQHIRRMNAKDFSNIPQPKGNITFDASKK
jgi:hypothetical protein